MGLTSLTRVTPRAGQSPGWLGQAGRNVGGTSDPSPGLRGLRSQLRALRLL